MTDSDPYKVNEHSEKALDTKATHPLDRNAGLISLLLTAGVFLCLLLGIFFPYSPFSDAMMLTAFFAWLIGIVFVLAAFQAGGEWNLSFATIAVLGQLAIVICIGLVILTVFALPV